MLENQFFPTPPKVIETMLEPFTEEYGGKKFLKLPSGKGIRSVLDPSAGSGALLEAVLGYESSYSAHKTNKFSVEIQPDLREVLKSKKFPVIGTDWLEFDEPLKFDLIVSNPPFSEGVDHILKSLKHLENGGSLVCLLNANTLTNPHSAKRQLLLKVIARNWGVEYTDNVLEDLTQVGAVKFLGACFRDSERPTDVEVACVWVNLPLVEYKGPNYDRGNYTQSKDELNPEFDANPLASTNFIKTLVIKYKKTIELIEARAKIDQELKWWLTDFEGGNYRNNNFLKPDFQAQIWDTKVLFWEHVFQKTDLANRIGNKAQSDFRDFALNQKNLEFNESNIVEMLQVLLGSISEVMDSLVTETFDRLVGYHKDNKKHTEGWKTNSPGKIKANKVIVPEGISPYANWGWGYKRAFFEDLDKSLCWVSGKDYAILSQDKATVEGAITTKLNNIKYKGEAYDEKFECEWFYIRIYKKGTVHLWFKDAKLAQDYQRKANSNRKWIPENDA